MVTSASCHSENDLRQASGKGWEAAERMVKAVADARGWPHSSRHDLYRAVGRLAKEMPDAQLQTLFSSANALDQNFHEGWMTEDAVEQALDEVEEFAGRLADLIA